MKFPLQIAHTAAPEIHFKGERLPGIKDAVDQMFHAGFDAGAGLGGSMGLTVGCVLGAVGASLVWVLIVFCLVRLFNRSHP